MTNDRLSIIPDDLREEIIAHQSTLEQRNQRLQQENVLLHEELKLLRAYRFGRSSEKLSDGQVDYLANEVFDAGSSTAPEESAAEDPEKKTPKKRPNHPGRHPFPEHLTRIVEEVPLSADERTCDNCGSEKDVVGTEVREELELIPATLQVRAFHHEVGQCPCCTDKPAMAEGPDRLIPGGSAGPSVHAQVIVNKFVDHLPLDRQERRFKREGIYISRKTMCGWLKQLSPFLERIALEIREELVAGSYLQVDETPSPMQHADKIGKHHQSYFWVYNRPDGPVYFDFRTDRSRAGPTKILANFSGHLQHDDFSAYRALKLEGITHVACMAHIRRKFFEAEKAGDVRARRILRMIGWLYKIEKRARKEKLSVIERHQLRKRRAPKIMRVLQLRITRLALNPDITPASKLGRACRYALNNWEHMSNYLDAGHLEIDNNLVENEIRPITLGRKNWMSIGSEVGGEMAAVYLTWSPTANACRSTR